MFTINSRVKLIFDIYKIRERSHMTSAAEGRGFNFKMLTELLTRGAGFCARLAFRPSVRASKSILHTTTPFAHHATAVPVNGRRLELNLIMHSTHSKNNLVDNLERA